MPNPKTRYSTYSTHSFTKIRNTSPSPHDDSRDDDDDDDDGDVDGGRESTAQAVKSVLAEGDEFATPVAASVQRTFHRSRASGLFGWGLGF